MSSFKRAFALSKAEVEAAAPFGTVIATEYEATGSLILIPEPSRDPADPLNWPLWRRIVVLVCMSSYAFITNFTSASIASAFPLLATPMAFNPPVSYDKLSHLVAVNVLMIGVANIVWVPLGNSIGRRPVVILGPLLLCLFSVWAGLAKDYTSLLAARALMGIGGAAADTVAPRVVGEIFFLHESGRALGFYTTFLALGPSVGGISGGYIAGNLGLDWIHWINVILAGALFVCNLLLVPETYWDRRPTPEESDESKMTQVQTIEKAAHETVITTEHAEFTFSKSLGFRPPARLTIAMILAPLKTLRFPGVWLVMLWYGAMIGGVVAMSTLGPTFVASPPYLWGHNAGLVNVGGIIGVAVAAAVTIFQADRMLKARNMATSGTIIEPEGRLPVVFPGLFLATTGLWVFGFSAQYPSPNAWVGLEVGIGMVSFGIMQAPSIGFNYLIESYGPLAADCFTTVTIFRSVITFAWSFFVGTWAKQSGPAVPFGVFGGMMGFFSLLVIPFCLWGKRFRIATEHWI